MVAEHGRPRLAEHIVDVLVPLIIEEIVEVLKTVFQEQISEKICKHIGHVHVPRAVEQATEVPKTSSRDRTWQCTAEQILDVLVPEMAKQVVEVSETVSRDGVQQRTVEQTVDAPVPQAVEELAEVSRVFSQDGIQQRAMEQTTPATSLAEMIVEVPVARTPEKAQQVANTLVQHNVNTVEVERPQIIKQTWQKPIIQEKINQVTKHVEVPLVQFFNKVDEIPVVAQRQILMVQTVQKTMEIPQLQCDNKMVDNPEVPQVHVVKKTVEDPQFEIVQKTVENPENFPQLLVADKVVDVPVVLVVQAPQVQVSEKTVEISQLQAVEKIVEIRETQMIQSIQTSESLKPDDPDAKTKFFAEEALHGVGGLIFDTHGNRVASELGGRNCVTGEMRKNKPSFSLALNKATSDDIAWQRKQYTGRGVTKLHESGTTLAEGMEAPVSKMSDSIEAHCQASLKSAKDPDGEPCPAFTSDKSWDEASGKTVAHRQVPLIQRVQKTVEVPRVQFIDKLVDDPAVMRREAFNIEARELIVDESVGAKQQGSERPLSPKKRRLPVEIESGFQSGEQSDLDAESKHERFKDLVLPSSQSCLCVSIASSDEGEVEAGDGSTEDWTEVKKRGRKKPTKKSTASSGGEEEELKQHAEATSLVQGGEHRREEDAQVPGSELVQMAPNMGAGGSHPQAMMDQERDKELREIRRMVEFLVHRERKLDVRTDVAARRLERLERESSQLEDEELETSLEGALTDRTKVAKLIVDKWFVDKGYGFGRAPTGEVVFIHASVVQGAKCS